MSGNGISDPALQNRTGTSFELAGARSTALNPAFLIGFAANLIASVSVLSPVLIINEIDPPMYSPLSILGSPAPRFFYSVEKIYDQLLHFPPWRTEASPAYASWKPVVRILRSVMQENIRAPRLAHRRTDSPISRDEVPNNGI